MVTNILQNKKMLKIRFSQLERVKVYKKIASNLSNGLDILTSLKKLYLRYKKNKDFKQYIIKDWIKVIESGKTFPIAVKNWVPNIEYMLISSGEGEALVKGLKEAINIGSAMSENKKVIIKGLIMPIFLFMLIFGLLIGFKCFLAEALALVIPVEHWPEKGKMLYDVSDFLMRNIVFILIFLIAFGYAIMYSLNKLTGDFRKFLDYIPPYSIYKEYQSYSFLISLSSLMQAGTSVLESFKKLRSGSANIWLNFYINKMITRMGNGLKPTDSLNVGLFNNELMGDIEDYSDSKEFDETLYILSKDAINASTETIQTKMKVIQFVLLILVVLTLVFILNAVFSINLAISDYLAFNNH